jgi:hypothetical protein
VLNERRAGLEGLELRRDVSVRVSRGRWNRHTVVARGEQGEGYTVDAEREVFGGEWRWLLDMT